VHLENAARRVRGAGSRFVIYSPIQEQLYDPGFNSNPLQCEGGSPCVYCTKKKIECITQDARGSPVPVFVNRTQDTNMSRDSSVASTSRQTAALEIHENVSLNPTARVIANFFSVYLVRNDFTAGALNLDAIVSQFQKSSSLYHAVAAVGALDLVSTTRSKPSPVEEKRAARLEALTSYRNSVTCFRTEIQDPSVKDNNACLWTTLFLGLFEVRDKQKLCPNGGFINSHIAHG